MKKLIAIPAVVFCTLVLFTSCTKSSSDSFDQNATLVPDRIITATISPGQSHVVTINDIGDLSIVRQASHFKISQTGVDPKYKSLLYTYSPAEGFTGSDEVLLVHKIHSATNPDGSCYAGSEGGRTWRTYIAVKINVAN